jgi:hypothetical protein
MEDIDIKAHLQHLLAAAPEDQEALLQRVAAMAWSRGYDAGLGHGFTDPETPNPYSTVI